MSKLFFVAHLCFISFFLSGCLASALSLGSNKSYCEENGCDYSDAGVCKEPYFVLNNKQSIKSGAYKGIDCYSNKDNAYAK